VLKPPPASLRVIELTELRRLGAQVAADEAMTRLALDHLDGFWIHLDVDVLDDAIMPAVDYRMPAGLSWSELEIVLRTALRSGKAVGLEVTIFNPRLDLDGHIARDLVASLAAAMT
jgi:arginase